MSELQAFSRNGNEGFFIVTAKSKERIHFPVPSDLPTPQVWINAGSENASILNKNNMGVQIVMPKTNDTVEIKIRYEIS